MGKKENIVRYSMEEIKEKLARGEGKTDFDREVSEEEIERQIASDPDLYVPDNWRELAFRGLPPMGRENKRLVSIRYSPRVIDYFKSRSEEHTSELQSLMRTSYAVFCLKKKNKNIMIM